MATIHSVLSAMSSAIIGVTSGLVSAAPSTLGLPLTVNVGLDWPSTKAMMTNTKADPNPSTLVTVFDAKASKNSTRWNPIVLGQTINPSLLTSGVSVERLLPGQTTVILLATGVAPGDAVSALFTDYGASLTTPMWAAVAIATASDTLTTMATKLAAAINLDPLLSTWVTATSSGAAVSIRSISRPFAVKSYTGNGATETIELGRRARVLWIVCWSRSIEDRDSVTNAIEPLLASLELNRSPYDSGLALSDGSSGKLSLISDFNLDEATLSDTYRHDFHVVVDYPVTTTDQLYAVLAPIFQRELP